MSNEGRKLELPSNARRELKEGEVYEPIISDKEMPLEVTGRSLSLGLLMAMLFSFAAAYLGLKVGQVFEAAIPISILAVGLGVAFKRKSTITENVIIQSIGSASGVVVAGGIFTIPALYILNLKPSFVDTFLAAFLGGCLGILFMIPLRRYFCAEQHGKLPFPEACATTEILVAGETGGKQAKVLGISMAVGGLYDFLADALKGWNYHLATFDSRENTTSLLGGVGQSLYENFRIVLRLESLAAYIGLGYIVGLRYSAVIAAGSLLSFLVLVPLVFYFGKYISPEAMTVFGGKVIANMNEWAIFKTYVQKIGIGAIAAAGIIGIIKMSPVIMNAFGLAFKQIFAKQKLEDTRRTQKDIPMNIVLLVVGLVIILTAVFFSMKTNVQAGVSGLFVVVLLAFLFTTVAGYATAVVGTNPVSGMTLITLIILSVVLSGILPLDDPDKRMEAQSVALVMGCVVCTALSMAGGFVTDLKVGYWIGATPYNQQRFKFLGTLVASASVALAILVIQKAYGFTVTDPTTQEIGPNPAVPAPQGNLMATIISSAMDPSQSQPWLLYAIGVIIAIILEMTKVPPLAFALGMYLPIELNVPLMIGGFLSYLIGRSSKDTSVVEERNQRGTLIASGFIAGGALMGMVGALLNLELSFAIPFSDYVLEIDKPIRFLSIGQEYIVNTQTNQWEAGELSPFVSQWGQHIGLALLIGLCLWFYYYARSAKKET